MGHFKGFLFLVLALKQVECFHPISNNNVDKFSNRLDEVLLRNETFIWSPLSVYSTLKILQKISDGETNLELNQILGSSTHETNHSSTVVIKQNELGWDAAFKQASAIFVNNEGKSEKNFTTTVMENIKNLYTFNGDVNEINKWMKDNTAGLIERIVDERTHAKMIAVNAVIFQGKWKSPFKLGAKKSFKGLRGNIEVDFLFKRTTEDYGEFENYKVLKLGYKDTGMKIFFIIPQTSDDILTTFKTVKSHLGDIVLRLDPTELDIYLPKARIYSGVDLKTALKKVGLKTIFDPMRANFSQIFENDTEQLYLENVIHKTVLELDEEGTKAAAGTAAILMPLSSVIGNVKEFTIDKPFILLVTDGRHIVFEGVVYDLDKTGQGQAKTISPLNEKFTDRIETSVVDGTGKDKGNLNPGKSDTAEETKIINEGGKYRNKLRFHGEPLLDYSFINAPMPDRFQQPEPKDPEGIRFPAKGERFHGVKLPQFFHE